MCMGQETARTPDVSIENAVHVLAFVVPCEAVADEENMRKLSKVKKYARLRGMHVDFQTLSLWKMQANPTIAP